MGIDMAWAPNKHGVWHRLRYGRAAHCDHRITLRAGDAVTDLARITTADMCKRCRAIVAALAKADPTP